MKVIHFFDNLTNQKKRRKNSLYFKGKEQEEKNNDKTNISDVKNNIWGHDLIEDSVRDANF